MVGELVLDQPKKSRTKGDEICMKLLYFQSNSSGMLRTGTAR